jgi:hypothetical protein
VLHIYGNARKAALKKSQLDEYKPGSRGIEGYRRWAHIHTTHHFHVQETTKTPITAADSRARVLELSMVFEPQLRISRG